MSTYDYVCKICGLCFERSQSITENPLVVCPECDGQVNRLICGGIGFIIGGGKNGFGKHYKHQCSLERTGKTCCGRDAQCHSPHCEGN